MYIRTFCKLLVWISFQKIVVFSFLFFPFFLLALIIRWKLITNQCVDLSHNIIYLFIIIFFLFISFKCIHLFYSFIHKFFHLFLIRVIFSLPFRLPTGEEVRVSQKHLGFLIPFVDCVTTYQRFVCVFWHMIIIT